MYSSDQAEHCERLWALDAFYARALMMGQCMAVIVSEQLSQS